MPHLHTLPGQHDTTISLYIVLPGKVPKFLLHMHRKFGKLTQLGGHIELDETPWQSVVHELQEESGYAIRELKLLQPYVELVSVTNSVVHPQPFLINTFKAGETHFHDDLCYVFVAASLPTQAPQDGESTDLRWLSVDELRAGRTNGTIPADVVDICEAIEERALGIYHELPAEQFLTTKPENSGL